MLNIGPQELLLILVVALLVVGPRRLPELGRSIGKGIREIRKAQDEVRKTIQVNLDDGRPTFDEARDGSKAGPNGTATAAATGTAAAGGDDAREISRTLGRGLAEIRRARGEIERSFRVDMDPLTPRRGSRTRSSSAKPRRRDGVAESGAESATESVTESVAETTQQVADGEDTGDERDNPQPE
jgi:sec-independent protein translocase protein TatA